MMPVTKYSLIEKEDFRVSPAPKPSYAEVCSLRAVPDRSEVTMDPYREDSNVRGPASIGRSFARLPVLGHQYGEMD